MSSNNQQNDEIITSKKLKQAMDRERGDCIPERNGDTNTLARRDKSFANFIDFYIKLIKKNKEKDKDL